MQKRDARTALEKSDHYILFADRGCVYNGSPWHLAILLAAAMGMKELQKMFLLAMTMYRSQKQKTREK